MNELLKIVISVEGEEKLVYKTGTVGKEEPLLSMLFPEYIPGEIIPYNSIRFKKNLNKYDSRNIWKPLI